MSRYDIRVKSSLLQNGFCVSTTLDFLVKPFFKFWGKVQKIFIHFLYSGMTFQFLDFFRRKWLNCHTSAPSSFYLSGVPFRFKPVHKTGFCFSLQHPAVYKTGFPLAYQKGVFFSITCPHYWVHYIGGIGGFGCIYPPYFLEFIDQTSMLFPVYDTLSGYRVQTSRW